MQKFKVDQLVYFRNYLVKIFLIYDEGQYGIVYKVKGAELHRVCQEDELREYPQLSIFDFIN
jgi:hypothetical protein